MKKLKGKISALKTEKRECNHHIKDDEKYVKKISKLLKVTSFERGMELFEELWEIKDTLSKEIASHLRNLKKYLPEALTHTYLWMFRVQII